MMRSLVSVSPLGFIPALLFLGAGVGLTCISVHFALVCGASQSSHICFPKIAANSQLLVLFVFHNSASS